MHNKFVLTTTPYVSEPSAVDPEWWLSGSLSFLPAAPYSPVLAVYRLSKEALKFYDVSSWPESPVRGNLERVSKQLGRQTKELLRLEPIQKYLRIYNIIWKSPSSVYKYKTLCITGAYHDRWRIPLEYDAHMDQSEGVRKRTSLSH